MSSASQKPGHKPAPFPDLSPASSPKKRKHEDDDDEPAVPRRKTFRTYAEHQKHETHYYLDGNMLLQIGKTRFKVHRSRLASESSWFQALVDHYNGSTPEGTTVNKEVDDVANEADNVGDDPIFFLDVAEEDNVPTADEFAALLTAMYSGIDYVFTPPSIDDIRLLYGAAWYYSVDKYHDFAHKFLEKFFPPFNAITKEPSLHNAVQGICMGDKFNLQDILPRALHELARASTTTLEECRSTADDKNGKEAAAPEQAAPAPASNAVPPVPLANSTGRKDEDQQMAGAAEEENEDDEGSDSEDNDDDDDDDSDTIKQISSKHYTRILILQRHLSSTWDLIVKELMTLTCSASCGFSLKVLPVFDAVAAVRLKYPCDPILGIEELLRSSVLAANYCKHMRILMTSRMNARKAWICNNLEAKWTK